MTYSIPISRRRLHRSSGNLLVEAMLVLLPTFALLSGFFDVTFAVFNWAVIQNAAREGVRYAITFQTMSGRGQDASIAQTVINNGMGMIPATVAVDSTNSTQFSITTNYYTQLNPNTPLAGGTANIPGNIVEVGVVNYNLNWMIPISGTVINPFRNQAPATINVYARDVLNGFPAGTSSVTR